MFFISIAGPVFGLFISAAWPRSRPSLAPVICLGLTCLSLLLFVLSQRPSFVSAGLALAVGAFATYVGWLWQRPSSSNVRDLTEKLSGPETISTAKKAVAIQREPIDCDVQQQQERWNDPSGIQHARGIVQVEIAALTNLATAHVGFIPPFLKPPTVTAECHSDLDVRVSVSQALWHGATFELKLKSPLETASRVMVEYHAEA